MAPNRLATETSPYLRQHADNPVDWYPWGEAAFAEAARRDVPILLSVGYSSCHWCHVMAHESFENPQIAAAMNQQFVNVKVDREERPDVDAVYMQAVQAMTGQGGWPMTVFLAPDGRPFYGGTYFPPDDRPGHPGFVRLMEAVTEAWRNRRDDLLQSAGQLHEAIAQSTAIGTRGEMPVPPQLLRTAVDNLRDQFDPRFGGFGRAPKFPQAMTLSFLLDVVAAGEDPSPLSAGATPSALTMATVSLDAMAAGGIYDQVGGGFHRYSVDAHWLVPHFEKMLYDQALLTRAYVHGWLVTDEDRYRRVVEETIGYVLDVLRHPDGGFYSAEDADSEGIEGKFYCWSHEELHDLCGDDFPEIGRVYGITMRGNFEDPHTGFRGNILHAVGPTDDRPEALDRVLPKLREVRAARVRPGLDDKVLLGWNALFLRALAEAADAFGRDDWMDAARTNARFLLGSMRRADGRLLRSWQNGRAADIPAFAEDHGALLEALVTLAEVDDPAWLADATTVAEALVTFFADDERGGFHTTGSDAEALIVRPKDFQDNATPSENSLAANGLLRLGALTGNADLAERGARWVRTLAPVLGEHPTAFAHLLEAARRVIGPSRELVLVGDPADAGTVALRDVLRSTLVPGSVRLIATPATDPSVSPLLEGRVGDAASAAAAYVCEGTVCQLPAITPEGLREQLAP